MVAHISKAVEAVVAVVPAEMQPLPHLDLLVMAV
jgi:hypothetical protein